MSSRTDWPIASILGTMEFSLIIVEGTHNVLQLTITMPNYT